MKKKVIMNIFIVIILIAGITFLLPVWYSMLSSNIIIRLPQILLPYILYISVILIMNMCIEHKSWKDLGFSKKAILKQVGIGILLAAFLSLLFTGVPFLLKFSPTDILPKKDKALVFAIIYKFLFIGFGEELIFRGYLQNRFSILFSSKWWSLLVPSLLFGVWHYILNGNLLQVGITFIIGFILGLSTMKIKNCTTLSVSIAHGLYDSILTVLSFFLL